MSVKDVIGLVLIIIGVPLATAGWRLLGATWTALGMALSVIGVVIVMTAAREKRLLENLRKEGGVAGDYADRHYLSGESASFSSHADHGSADSGGDGG